MKNLAITSCCTAVLAAAMAATAALPARANDILAEWATVKPPPVPELKSVTVDPKTTALLILDLMKANCGPRPRCVATIPNVKKLVDAARANDMMLFYTLVGQDRTPNGVIDPGIAPRAGEWVDQGWPDKFLGSDLDQRLKDKGIKTVIITGTSAQGTVIGTSAASAQRGYNVIVPIDGMSSEDAYNEQYSVWHLYKAAPTVVVAKVTLTRSDMMTFPK